MSKPGPEMSKPEKIKEDMAWLRAENDSQHEQLEAFKEGITKHYRNKKWDRFKKHCNDYELVFTSTPEYPSISAISPISRSFFKLWETMQDYDELLDMGTERVNVAFLGEGPGGFVEAVCRRRAGIEGDRLFGMTLISKNKNVPEWKLTHRELYGKSFNVVVGADGTGDLYDVANIDVLVDKAGGSSLDLVTADGGFDFSGNFSCQEHLSTRLICAEIYAAILLSKVGGRFFLKVYDIRLVPTIVLLCVLAECYTDVLVTKPMSSRPANSEKYLICTGFKGCDEGTLAMLRSCVSTGDLTILSKEESRITRSFMRNLIRVNMYFIKRQIGCIDKTLQCIQKYDVSTEHAKRSMVESLCKSQIAKSHAWCTQYGVGVSDAAMSKYELTTSLQ